MRILVSTTAGLGHFRPMLPFAAASVAAGHQVAVTAPHAFAPHVDAAGYPFLPFMGVSSARVDKLLEDSEQNPASIDHFGAQLFGGLAARAALPGIRDAIETYRPDLIVRDVAERAAELAAEIAGLPPVETSVALFERLACVRSPSQRA